MKLVAKYGRNWRLRVLDYEVIKFLQLERDIHKPLCAAALKRKQLVADSDSNNATCP